MQKILSLMVMSIMLLLVSCDNPVGANQPTEITTTEPVPVEGISEDFGSQERLFPASGHEQARDVVVAHVAGLAGLPLTTGGWTFQDQTQQNPDNGLTWLFTNGPWVAQVSVPAISPEPMEFSVVVDHMSAIIRWEGKIDSYGNIVETNFIQGSQPESPGRPDEPSWVGIIVSNPPGSQFDDYFQSMDQNGMRYGIDGADDAIKEQLVSYRDSETILQVWGNLQRDVPDSYGVQLLVTRIEPY